MQSSPSFRSSPLLAGYRLFLLFGWTMLFALVGLPFCLRGAFPLWLTRFWHRGSLRIIGLDLRLHGTPYPEGPLLLVPNHISYLDIPVMASLLPCSFVAKDDIAGWPVAGWLARMQQTIFIRRKREEAHRQQQQIIDRLARRDNLVIFIEGTSGDGNRVLPFKSTLLQVVLPKDRAATPQANPARLQPVTIAYTRLDGTTMGRGLRPFVAWYGDMELARHFWHFLGMGRVGVDVVFHETIIPTAESNRKELAEACRQKISTGLQAALSGRLEDL